MAISTNQIDQVKKTQENELAENSAVAKELEKIEDLKRLQQQFDARSHEALRSNAKLLDALSNEKGYHQKLQKDPGIKILSKLAKDLASLGLVLTQKPLSKSANSKVNDELEHILDKANILSEDKFEVKNSLTREAVKRSQGREERQNEQEKQFESQQKIMDIKKLINSSGVKEVIQQYSSAYAQEALQSSPEAKEKLQEIQDKLKEKGFSKKDIDILGKTVKRSLESEFVSDIQDSFIQHISLSENAFQLVTGSNGLGGMFEGVIKEENFKEKGNLVSEGVKRTQGGEREKEAHGKQVESQGKKQDIKKAANSTEAKETVQQYASAYAQFALIATPEAREKLEDAKDRLRKKGYSERDIFSIERAVRKSHRAERAAEVKGSLTQHMFSSKNSFDFVVTSRKLNNSYEQAIEADAVSGDREAVKDEMNRMAECSHEEIRDFIGHAVESKLMERHISGMDNRAEVRKLVEFGHKVGFNFSNFLKTWEQKKFDLGLFVLEVANAEQAENRGEISIGEVSAGGVSDKHGYEMTPDEERELLINQLRAEYMKKAITGDPFAVFSFAPKIRKLKNGLIKLGLIPEDFSRIEKEAKVLARYRTLEMLKDAFIERSTYYELSGPAYGLLKNKIKGLVSNLERLEMKLTKEEIDILRDEANRQMHDHTIIELKSAVAILDSQENPAVEQKVPLMVKLIQRLKEESGFSHGVGEDIDEVIFRHENDQIGVKEHA